MTSEPVKFKHHSGMSPLLRLSPRLMYLISEKAITPNVSTLLSNINHNCDLCFWHLLTATARNKNYPFKKSNPPGNYKLFVLCIK